MLKYRLYVDESGDHGYKGASKIENRYLGITGILIEKTIYDTMFQPQLEQLKQVHFSYDIDNPPILVRNKIIGRKGVFGVLANPTLKSRWAIAILHYFAGLEHYAQVFTVVVDKYEHLEKYPTDAFDPYDYGFRVLLRRVRGYLAIQKEQTDVIPESRNGVDDKELKKSYNELRYVGDRWSLPEDYQAVYPIEDLKTRRKDQNVGGLQLADLMACGQKLETIKKEKMPLPREISPFTKRLNSTIKPFVNPYGQYLLA